MDIRKRIWSFLKIKHCSVSDDIHNKVIVRVGLGLESYRK